MKENKVSMEQLKAVLERKKTKPAGKYAEMFFRPFTYRVVLFFVRNNINANTATAIHILLGIIGLLLILAGTKACVIAGVISLQLWFFTDLVDGEVARFREEISVTGIYYDIMSHYIMFPFIFAVFGIYGYQSEQNIYVLYLTVISCIAILLRKLVDDGQLTALTIQLNRDTENYYSIEHDGTKKAEKPINDNSYLKSYSVKKLIKALISLFYMLNNFPAIMNLMCLVLIYKSIISDKYPLILAVLCFYAVSLNIIWLWIIFNVIRKKKVDQKYFSLKLKQKN